MFDTSELRALVEDLGKVPMAAYKAVTSAVDVSGEELRSLWQSNAEATSGAHGKHYPKSITAEVKPGLGSVGVEVGPDSGKRQGGMGKGFEFGSVNQPPHMDGNRAADVIEPAFAKRVADAAAGAVSSFAADADIGKSEYTTRSGKTVMASPAQIAHWTRNR